MRWNVVLKDTRISRSYTQEELGKALGVSRNQIWRWECGRSYPDPANKRKIAKFVGEDVQILFKGDSNENV